MAADQGAGVAEALRLRLHPGQLVLGVILLLLLGLLAGNALVVASEQQAHTEAFVKTEAARTNTIFTMREGLNLSLSLQRYLLGQDSRREVQISRALLSQRLSVIDENGVRAGDLASPEYRRDLARIDELLLQLPTGYLPEDQHPQWTARLAPLIQDFAASARALGDGDSAAYRAQARATDEQLLANNLRQLGLLLASLLVALVLFFWVSANVRSNYRRAASVLEAEEAELTDTRSALEHASQLDRHQSEVLELIATGTSLSGVFERIAAMASATSHGSAFRLVSGTRSVQFPRDSEGEPAWSLPFGLDADGSPAGRLELLGSADEHVSPDTRMVAQRCCELAALAVERHRTSRQLTFQATHDALTGLANRSRLLATIDSAVRSRRSSQRHVALLFCDLDRFKVVNDSLGHIAGDHLLIEAARRISAVVRAEDTVARLGGDEFVVLCPSLPSRAEAMALAERISDALTVPYVVDGQEAFVGVSIGITFADDAEATGSQLLREADVAMYRGKMAEGPGINVFDASMELEAATRLDLDAALRRAVERGELRIYLQPLVDLEDGSIRGFESLVRWQRPGHGIQLPTSFIGLAEDNGLIVDIGRWMMRQSIELLARWKDDDVPTTISVNVSARQLRDPRFAEDVLAMLRLTGVAPSSLVIELTESTFIEVDAAQSTLAPLREAGIHIALDDFGTGYSSLTQLRRLPVDVLKLDRSFVAPLVSSDPMQRALLAAMVRLASAMSLGLVIEGIETEAEREVLLGMGATIGQGYLFSPPLAPDEALALLVRSRERARARA